MKTLVLDLETSPNLAHVWSLWKQNISLAQLRESGNVISFAAKWHEKRAVSFYSDFHNGHEEMINAAHGLMSEADAVVTWNGEAFDIPWLHTEFLDLGLEPPAPHKNIDLLKLVRKRFRYPSYKLDYVAQRLGVGGKVNHYGHELWVDCLAGDPKAWALMRRYNVQDVRITGRVLDRTMGWLDSPHWGLYTGTDSVQDVCQRCGSSELKRRGYAYTNLGKYKQYRCDNCGGWSRGKKAIAMVDLRAIS